MTAFRERTITATAYLRARASVARRLIREGAIDPYDALAYVVWPTEEIREAELETPTGTIIGRAFSVNSP